MKCKTPTYRKRAIKRRNQRVQARARMAKIVITEAELSMIRIKG